MSNKLYPLVPVGYLLLGIILSLLGNSLSFLLAFGCYALLVKVISLWVEREKRRGFFNIVFVFLLVYSVWSVLGQVVFINDPFTDFYVNLDETKFIHDAITLAELNYSNIWHTAFTKFQYNGSPLFYAWLGSLQRLTGLNPFYGLLFLKLNVAFFASFVPGVVYLLCSRVINYRSAYRAAIVYGLFTFTFFYAVGLMRDIHIALIYALALYIVTREKNTLKDLLLISFLGLAAYFIRVENGLFFVAFIGIMVFKIGGRYRALLSSFSVLFLIAVIVALGGLDFIFGTASNTLQNYSERSVSMADADSLGAALNQLPIPLNYLSKAAFGQITPFPFWAYLGVSDSLLKKLFYLPQAIAALFWFMVWTRIIVNFKKIKPFFKKYKLVVGLVLLYIFMVSIGQAMPRRLMAVYPFIFMGYLFVSPKAFTRKDLRRGLFFYGLLVIIYLFIK